MIKRIVIEDSRQTVRELLVQLGFPLYSYAPASLLNSNELELAKKTKVTVTVIQLWGSCVTEAIECLAECKKSGNWPAIFRSGINDSKVSDGLVGFEEYRLNDNNEVISRVDTDMVWKPSQLPLADLFKNDWWLPDFDDVKVTYLNTRICDLKFDNIDEEYCMEGTGESVADWLNGKFIDIEVS